MVGVKFEGRLGNQIFQYVFLQYLKSRRKGIFYFFSNPHHAYLQKYFDLGGYENFTLSSKPYSAITRFLPAIFKLKEVFIHNWVAPKPFLVTNFIHYKGYFQSAYYYEQIKPNIQLKLKSRYVNEFNLQFGELFKNNKIVVVHIRRTDYISYGERRKRDISLPMSYFKDRLAAIENISDYKVIFVSDDMKYVKDFFPIQSNYLFSNNSEIIDFQILQNADISIISNSTFAWWACYLSPKKNIVYGPKNWFGFKIGREHPKGIMTEKFIWCDAIS